MKPRQRILGLFQGERGSLPPVFSGMGNVTLAGLELLGAKFPEIHQNAELMAAAAATSYRLFGFGCAVVPFDLCVEAEALGAEVNFHPDTPELCYPTVSKKLILTPREMALFAVPPGLAERGRLPLVRRALEILRQTVGTTVAIGSYVLGPFTLAGQICELDVLLKSTLRHPEVVAGFLKQLRQVIAAVGRSFFEAGADYLTVREMGASLDSVNSRIFQHLVLPELKELARELPRPRVLHICGDTNGLIELVKDCGYDAISVEQKNDLARSRRVLAPQTLLLGAVDGYGTLAQGTPEDVANQVFSQLEAGVDAVWPGCDIWPAAPLANLRALTAAVERFGVLKRKSVSQGREN